MITADALHTLAQQAQAITDRGGHYVFTVKANARTLHTQMAQAGWARRKPQHHLKEESPRTHQHLGDHHHDHTRVH